MSLWRMELLRLLRTRRLVALAGVYLLFGFAGPLTARYMEQILARAGGGLVVQVPDPTPVDGIVQYSSNAHQIGLLVALVVAAGALAFDARPQVAFFLRTRVASITRLLLPRFVVSGAAIVLAFAAGALAAWYQTTVLIGAPPAGAMAAGTVYAAVYLFFAVSVVAAATAVVVERAAAVAVSAAVLLGLPLLGLLPRVGDWLPSRLVGAMDAMVAGAPAGEFAGAVVTTLLATGALLALAVRLLARREV